MGLNTARDWWQRVLQELAVALDKVQTSTACSLAQLFQIFYSAAGSVQSCGGGIVGCQQGWRVGIGENVLPKSDDYVLLVVIAIAIIIVIVVIQTWARSLSVQQPRELLPSTQVQKGLNLFNQAILFLAKWLIHSSHHQAYTVAPSTITEPNHHRTGHGREEEH